MILSNHKLRSCSLLIFLLLLYTALPLHAQFSGGSGTEEDPYHVATAEDLDELRNHTDAHFLQTADIDLSGFDNWEPIAREFDTQFTGTYNGDGYIIENLTINRGNEDVIGLFGNLEDGILENITLENIDVTGNRTVGGLVGYNDGGYIFNVSATGMITGNDSNIGGVIGFNQGTVSGNTSSVVVSGQSNLGGLIGWNEGDVSESSASGTITGDGSIIGGLIGGVSGGTIAASSATGDVTGVFITGGFIGEVTRDSETNIIESFATGSVTGGSDTGGLIGHNNDGEGLIIDSYATGDVVSDGTTLSVGGLVGYNVADIQRSYAEGIVNGGGWDVGGLIGYNLGNVSESFATGDVTGGEDQIGGLMGTNDGTVADSYAHGNVHGSTRVGGLIGWNNTDVETSYSSGEVTGNENVGGLIGQGNEPFPVTDSYWDMDTSGQPDSDGGTGLSTGEMTGQAAEEHMTGFDFENIWMTTDEYPELRLEDVEDEPFAGGSGTVEEPFQITEARHINNMRDYLDAYFIQISDIDISALNSWDPIGSETNPFTGSFDGDNNTIYGLSIDRPGEDHLGLFGYIGGDAAVTNVRLENVDIEGNEGVGGISGYNDGGVIVESSVSGSVAGESDVGGLAGKNDGGTIEYSYADVAVTGNVNAGGLVGSNTSNGIIRNAYAWGDVTGSENTGGLAGYVPSGTIEITYSAGTVDGNVNAGGLIGSGDENNATVAFSYWDVNTSGHTTSAGGTGLTTGEMTGFDAPNNMTGFDFDETWAVTQSYPRLQWGGTYEVVGTVAGLISAIESANNNPGQFAVIELGDNQTYTLTEPAGEREEQIDHDWWPYAGLPIITSEITIIGNGSTIERVQIAEPDFDDAFRIIEIASSGELHLDGVTIAHGFTPGYEVSGSGAGIYNAGTLIIANSTVRDNDAGFLEQAGRVEPFMGGGIFNQGMLEIYSSTISGNRARFGGGIYNTNDAALTMKNSTVTGNTAEPASHIIPDVTVGGGIYNEWNASVTLLASTVTDNEATDGGGIANDHLEVNLELINSLVAGNSAENGPDVNGTVTENSSYNLIGDGSEMEGINHAENGNMVGTSANPINPLLGDLDDYDGPTLTHALLVDSPAIDAIPLNESGCGDVITTDQRGVSRPQGIACDIGAFEADRDYVVRWIFFLADPIVSSPFVGSTVYVGSSDNNLYAIDEETGDEKWSFTTGDEVFSSPLLYNEAVFVGSNDGYLYAVDSQTGDELWTFETGDAVRSSPAVTSEMVYVGSDDNHIYAVDIETGIMEWSYATGDAVGSSPAVAGGFVYVGSGDGYVYALDAETGDIEWSFETGDAVFSSPAVSGGTVYIGSDDGNLYALDAMTGEESWHYQTGEAVQSSPVVGDDLDLVFVGSDDQHLYAVNSGTGEEVWSYETGGSVFSSPEVAYEAVFVGSDDGRLYALEAATGEELWDMPTGGPVRSSPAVAYGNVYVGSDDGSLYSTEVDVPTSAPEYIEHIPEKYTLYQNYPNPFNPATTIRYSLPEAVEVTLVIYDILGRKVTTLVDDYREPGEHSVLFDAGHLSSGVYIYQLRAAEYVETKRLILLK